jgi:peptidoglycan/LPS O-acetylase OafA/YrhL
VHQSRTRPKLSERVTVGLDMARASSACYVVLHHVAIARGWSNGFGLIFRFGQEAVLVFFLLSGFVIFANEQNRATHPRGYYVRRLRRIYPALIGAMVISSLVALDNKTFIADFSWSELLGTLFNIQDISLLKPGVIVDPYLHNDPLWSLSYEMAFYLVFPFVLSMSLRFPSQTNHSVGVICCASYVVYAVFPNHWSLVTAYFLVWWFGAMAAEAYLKGARDVRSIGAPFCWLLLLTIISAVTVLVSGYHGLGFYPFLMLRHFAFALIIVVFLFGPIGASIASKLQRFSRPAAAIASVSYGIYVLHVPILVNWHRTKNMWGLTVGIILLLVAAYLVDRQLNRFLPRAPVS